MLMKKSLLLIAALGVTGAMFAAPSRSMSEDYYWVNAGLEQPNNHERYTDMVALDTDEGYQWFDVPQAENGLLVQDLTDCFFYAKPGSTVYAELAFHGAWMHSYVYIDYDNDGEFYADVNSDGTPADGSDLVAYNSCSLGMGDAGPWYNSLGEIVSNNLGGDCGVLPEFTIPEDLAPGVYRIRFKVDWDSLDPAGNDDEKNKIFNNGGVIIDAMLMVYTDECKVINGIDNGSVAAADGSALESAPADRALTILVVPAAGYEAGDLTIKCGYNTDKATVENEFGNPQYTVLEVPASSLTDNTYTIPADMVRGNICVNGEMVKSSAIKAIQSADAEGETVIYNLKGERVADPQPGIYIVNGQKRVVK